MIKKFFKGIKQRFKDASYDDGYGDEFLVWFIVFVCGMTVAMLVLIGANTASAHRKHEKSEKNHQDTTYQRDTLQIVENIRHFPPIKHDITLVNTQTGDTMKLHTREGDDRYIYMQPGSHIVIETPTDSSGKVIGNAEINPILAEQVFDLSR